ncbi:MAG: hypothetical protein GQ569_03850 [Methylococcaceae bacterium]|nr:hypothetical protein [Methylococcaceae bacterium]
MAEKKEKDNFLVMIGVIAVITITLVMVLKQRETEHLAPTVETKAQVMERNHPPGNTFE